LKATETDQVHLCDQRFTAAALAASGPLPPGPFIDQLLEHVPPGKVRDGIGQAHRLPTVTDPETVAYFLGNGRQVTAHDTVPYLPGAWLRATEPLPEWINF
jgi:hypothetical protein